MATYLLAWNPNRWHWDNLQDIVSAYQRGETVYSTWSCGRNKSIRVGDTVFLIRLGREPKGIFAHGTVVSPSLEDTHWEDPNKTSQYVEYHINAIVNPETDKIITRSYLDSPPYSQMHWNIQGSGVRIPDEIAAALLVDWSHLVAAMPSAFPDDIDTTQTYFEGAQRIVVVNSYERNAVARKVCINHFGVSCVVCGFNFGMFYGEVGQGLIHVHHLVPISSIGESYELDPIQDLQPVCPNCHAIIHRRTPPFTVEEVKEMIRLKQ